MRIITLKGTFNGLYRWGDGWDSATEKKWNDYWRNQLKSYFWHFFEVHKGHGDAQYLVTTGGSIYLHPMNFSLVMQKFGGCYHYNEDGSKTEVHSEIEELQEICEECAAFCGGDFAIDQFKVTEI